MRNSLLFTPICLALVLCTALARADRPAALSAQTLKLPSGPASLKGLGESFGASIVSGAGSYSVPIELPPAPLKPSFALTYAAGRGKGAVGMSWGLPLLSIYRTTDKGAPAFTEADRFAVSGQGLNDELVRVDAATGTYRLKNEGGYALFVRNAAADSWTIRLPTGDTLYLGESEQAREGTTPKTHRWYVQRHADKFQHEIQYRYKRDQGRLYILSIRYQLQAHQPGGSLVPIDAAYQNEVTFDHQPRPDVYSDYSYGERVTTALRLERIIVTQGGSQRVLRTYVLSYRNSLLFSLLTKVEMTGEGGMSMRPLTFDYLEPTLTSGRYVEMVNRPPLEGLLNGSAQFEDMNRDSLPDLLVGTAGNYRYYENIDGVSWSSTPTNISGSPDRNLYDSDVILADFDGDGDRDVGHSQGGAFRYYPAGTTWRGVFQGFGSPVTLNTSDTGFSLTSREVKLSDLNSDGRTDLIWQKPGQDAQLLNTNDRLQASYITELPVDVDFQDSRVQLQDFNGDGLLDFVRQEIGWNPSRVRVWYGLGSGAYAAEQQMLNVPTGDASEFSLQDVNRDGQTDLVRVSGSRATYFLNDGNQRFTGARGDFYGLPSVSNTRRLMHVDMNGNGTTDIVWLTLDGKLTYLDLVGEPFFGLLARVDNGLGAVTDIAYRSSTAYAIDAKRAGSSWTTTLPISVPVVSEIAVTDSLDRLGIVPWESRTTYFYRDGYYDGPEREFRGFGMATTTAWGDETHESLVTETRMHVGRNLVSGVDEESLRGRPYLRILRNLDGEIYQSEETQWEQRWLCQEALGAGAPLLLPRCANYADKVAAKDSLVSNSVATAALTGTWEKASTPRYSASTVEYDAAWTRPARSRVLGEVTFSSTRTLGTGVNIGSATVASPSKVVTKETDYADDLVQWLIGTAYQERTLSAQGGIISQTRRYLDGEPFVGLSLGQIQKGLVTRVETWLDTENRYIAVARNQYNADGLLVAMQDANSNLVDLEYDAETHSLPVRERRYVEGGDVTFKVKYDTGTGEVLESTDANGRVSRYTYDGLGRADLVFDALGALVIDYDYEDASSQNPISKITTKTLIDRATGARRTSYQFVDGLGRPRLSKVAVEGNSYVASGYLELNARGGDRRVYDGFATSSPGFEAPPASMPFVARYHDAMSRPTDAVFPATADRGKGLVRTFYGKYETREFDERDTSERAMPTTPPFDGSGRGIGGRVDEGQYATITRFDALNRALEVEKKNEQGGVIATLKWKADYDPAGRIVGLMDPAWTDSATGNSRSKRIYKYDSLDRVTELVDPNLGRVRYAYDDLGNLRRRTDALDQEEGWEYGLANRLLRRTFKHDATGKPDYAYEYHYDAPAPGSPLSGAANLLGQLAWVEYPTGREHYSYDEQGQATDELVQLWNPATSSFAAQERDSYRRTETFDAEGKTASVALPGGFGIFPQYNARGLTSALKGGLGETRTLVSNITYDARGLVTSTDHGNGTRSCAGYDERGGLIATLTGKGVTCGAFGSAGSSLGAPNVGFQHLRYVRTHNDGIAAIQDLSRRARDASGKDVIPRLDATYQYDRLNELIYARDAQGQFGFTYDSTQNLTSRSFVATGAGGGLGTTTTLPTGTFTYGERGAGPNMITGAGGRSYDYDALGRLKTYRGYTLDYDVQSQLVSATKGATSVKFHYDIWGARRLVVVQRGSAAPEVHRYVFDEYELHNGDESWLVGAGGTTVEVTKSHGVVIDDNLYLLDQLLAYVNGSAREPKPLPAEYMDFDGDGDFDMGDYNLASQAYASPARERLGGDKTVSRYYHHDQISGTTHATDSTGELVTHMLYDVYGKTTQPKGMAPLHGFAGAALEAEQELGLAQFGSRFYAPELGRWITADRMIGESPSLAWTTLLEANLYSYGANNPVMLRDPSGGAAVAFELPSIESVAKDVAIFIDDTIGPANVNQIAKNVEAAAFWVDDQIGSGNLAAVGTFGSGIADTATFGATAALQDHWGTSVVVDRGSKLYKTGQYGYTALSVATGVQGGVRLTQSLASAVNNMRNGGAVLVSAGQAAANGDRLASGGAQATSAVGTGALGATGSAIYGHSVAVNQSRGGGGKNNKPTQQKTSQPDRPKGPVYKTNKEATEAADKLGFKKINETSKGQSIFSDGKRYITRDVDGHNGGAWKMADSVKNLGAKETRMGTYDASLTRIGD